MVVSPAFATRLPPPTVSLGMASPFASPDTMDHSPSRAAISFWTASWAPAAPARARTTIAGTVTRIRVPPRELVGRPNEQLPTDVAPGAETGPALELAPPPDPP